MMDSIGGCMGPIYMSGFWYVPIIFLLIIVLLFWAFLRNSNSHKRQSAQDVLNKHYANGDISKEEHAEKSAYLSKIKKGTNHV